MKFLGMLLFSLALTSCASRGLEVSDQISSEFYKKYKTVSVEGEEVLGVLEKGEAFSLENIKFKDERSKKIFIENLQGGATFHLRNIEGERIDTLKGTKQVKKDGKLFIFYSRIKK